MTATNPEIKSALMSRGIWPDFVRLREDEKLANGGTSRSQTLAALRQIAPDLVDLVRPRGRPRGNPPSNPLPAEKPKEEVLPKNAVGEPTPELSQSSADARRSEKDTFIAAEQFKRREYGVRDRVPKEMFAGRTCSISTAFMWAYSNLCFADASPTDAPSAVAWQMYVDMMTSPSLKADMLKSGLGAAMRKAEAEDETNGRFDGEGEYDVLAAIAGGGGER